MQKLTGDTDDREAAPKATDDKGALDVDVDLARSAGRVTLERGRKRAAAANDPIMSDRPGYDD